MAKKRKSKSAKRPVHRNVAAQNKVWNEVVRDSAAAPTFDLKQLIADATAVSKAKSNFAKTKAQVIKKVEVKAEAARSEAEAFGLDMESAIDDAEADAAEQVAKASKPGSRPRAAKPAAATSADDEFDLDDDDDDDYGYSRRKPDAQTVLKRAQSKVDAAAKSMQKAEESGDPDRIASARRRLREARLALAKAKLTKEQIAARKKAATDRARPKFATRAAMFFDENRDENGAIDISRSLGRGFSFVGHKIGKNVNAGASYVGGLPGRGINYGWTKVISGMRAVAGDNELARKAITGLDRSVRFVGTAVKATSKESLKWVASKFQAIGSTVMRTLRGINMSGVKSFFDWALILPLIVAPMLKGINSELEQQFGEHYITDFLKKTWDTTKDAITDKVTTALGLDKIQKWMSDSWTATVNHFKNMLVTAEEMFASVKIGWIKLVEMVKRWTGNGPNEEEKKTRREAHTKAKAAEQAARDAYNSASPEAKPAAERALREAEMNSRQTAAYLPEDERAPESSSSSTSEQSSQSATGPVGNSKVTSEFARYNKLSDSLFDKPAKSWARDDVQTAIDEAPEGSIPQEQAVKLRAAKLTVPESKIARSSPLSPVTRAIGNPATDMLTQPMRSPAELFTGLQHPVGSGSSGSVQVAKAPAGTEMFISRPNPYEIKAQAGSRRASGSSGGGMSVVRVPDQVASDGILLFNSNVLAP